MSQQQLSHPSLTSHQSSLPGCRMAILLSHQQIVFTIGTFVIERRDAFNPFVQCWNVACITTIGIAAGRICRFYKAFVLDLLPIRCRPVGSGLNIINLADRNMIEVHHITTNMRHRGFLAEQIAATGHAMLQWNGLDSKRAVLIDDLLLRRVNSMEIDFIVEIVTEETHLLLQHIL